MSKRLTPEWTESLDEAFGELGTKGRLGEEFLCKVFESWGWEYEWHQDDRKLQMEGIDISFRNPEWVNSYTCDVKNNMDKYGTIYIHEDWLFFGKSDRIFHVNPDTGWFCYYGRKDMQDWYTKGNKYIRLTATKRPKFVTTRKYDAK